MKNLTMKKILSLVMAVILTMSYMPGISVTAFANENYNDDLTLGASDIATGTDIDGEGATATSGTTEGIPGKARSNDTYTLIDYGTEGYFPLLAVEINGTTEYVAYCIDPDVDYNAEYPEYNKATIISGATKTKIEKMLNGSYPVLNSDAIYNVYGLEIDDITAYDVTQAALWYVISDETYDIPSDLFEGDAALLYDILVQGKALDVKAIELGLNVDSATHVYKGNGITWYGPIQATASHPNTELETRLAQFDIGVSAGSNAIVNSLGNDVYTINAGDSFYVKYNTTDGIDDTVTIEMERIVENLGLKSFVQLESILGQDIVQSVGYVIPDDEDFDAVFKHEISVNNEFTPDSLKVYKYFHYTDPENLIRWMKEHVEEIFPFEQDTPEELVIELWEVNGNTYTFKEDKTMLLGEWTDSNEFGVEIEFDSLIAGQEYVIVEKYKRYKGGLFDTNIEWWDQDGYAGDYYCDYKYYVTTSAGFSKNGVWNSRPDTNLAFNMDGSVYGITSNALSDSYKYYPAVKFVYETDVEHVIFDNVVEMDVERTVVEPEPDTLYLTINKKMVPGDLPSGISYADIHYVNNEEKDISFNLYEWRAADNKYVRARVTETEELGWWGKNTHEFNLNLEQGQKYLLIENFKNEEGYSTFPTEGLGHNLNCGCVGDSDGVCWCRTHEVGYFQQAAFKNYSGELNNVENIWLSSYNSSGTVVEKTALKSSQPSGGSYSGIVFEVHNDALSNVEIDVENISQSWDFLTGNCDCDNYYPSRPEVIVDPTEGPKNLTLNFNKTTVPGDGIDLADDVPIKNATFYLYGKYSYDPGTEGVGAAESYWKYLDVLYEVQINADGTTNLQFDYGLNRNQEYMIVEGINTEDTVYTRMRVECEIEGTLAEDVELHFQSHSSANVSGCENVLNRSVTVSPNFDKIQLNQVTSTDPAGSYPAVIFTPTVSSGSVTIKKTNNYSGDTSHNCEAKTKPKLVVGTTYTEIFDYFGDTIVSYPAMTFDYILNGDGVEGPTGRNISQVSYDPNIGPVFEEMITSYWMPNYYNKEYDKFPLSSIAIDSGWSVEDNIESENGEPMWFELYDGVYLVGESHRSTSYTVSIISKNSSGEISTITNTYIPDYITINEKCSDPVNGVDLDSWGFDAINTVGKEVTVQITINHIQTVKAAYGTLEGEGFIGIYKEDYNQLPEKHIPSLNGARFEIWELDNNGNIVDFAQSMELKNENRSSIDGYQVHFSEALRNGKYLLREVEAPSEYVLPEFNAMGANTWVVEVNGAVNTIEGVTVIDNYNSEMTHKPWENEITIHKTDQNGNDLLGSKFLLENITVDMIENSTELTDPEKDDILTNLNYALEFEPLEIDLTTVCEKTITVPYGIYKLTEIQLPDKVSKTAESIIFTLGLRLGLGLWDNEILENEQSLHIYNIDLANYDSSWLNSGSGTIYIEVENIIEDSFYLFKHDRKHASKSLAGAKFDIFMFVPYEELPTFDYPAHDDSVNFERGEWVKIKGIETEQEAKSLVDNLPLGWYKIVETEAPDGFLDNEREYFIFVNGEDVRTIHIFNDNAPIPYGQLIINKTDGNVGIGPATFELYDTATDYYLGDIITNSSGIWESGLIATGEYYLIEKIAPAGYELNSDPIQVTVSKNEITTKEVINTLEEIIVDEEDEYGWITIQKKSDNGTNIGPAEFDLYKLVENTETFVEHVVTDENGRWMSGDLLVGAYYLIETVAPQNHLLSSGSLDVTINANATTNMDIYNTKRGEDTGWFEIQKKDGSGNNIGPAKFKLMDEDEIQIGGIFSTDDSGYYKSELLNIGNYKLVEVEAPTGYVLSAAEIDVRLRKDSTTSIEVINLAEPEKPIEGKAKFTLQKKNHRGYDIGVAKFKLLDSDKKIILEFETDDKGYYVSDDLSYGIYYIVETQAPVGYKLNSKEIQIDLNESKTYQFEVINQPKETSPGGGGNGGGGGSPDEPYEPQEPDKMPEPTPVVPPMPELPPVIVVPNPDPNSPPLTINPEPTPLGYQVYQEEELLGHIPELYTTYAEIMDNLVPLSMLPMTGGDHRMGLMGFLGLNMLALGYLIQRREYLDRKKEEQEIQ